MRCLWHLEDIDEEISLFLANCIARHIGKGAWKIILKRRLINAVPELLDQIEEEPNLHAFYALTGLGAEEAFEPLMGYLQGTALWNRPFYIKSLADLADERAIPFLMETLHRNLPGIDPNVGTYESWSISENTFAAIGLGKVRAAQSVKALLRVLELPYKDLRNAAVAALGEIGLAAKAALPILHSLVDQMEKRREDRYVEEDRTFVYLARNAIASIESIDGVLE